MMDKIKILYVGNKLSHYGLAPSVIETLGHQLQLNGFKVYYAGIRLNPFMRLYEMIITTLRLRKEVHCVLIDTYSTFAFWYAFITGLVCRFVKLRYITILHGGNLPERLNKSHMASNILFRNSYRNVAVSSYLKFEFENAGYKTIVIPNNIDISKYPFKARKNPRPKLLWVRSFHKQYNPIMAVNVLVELLKTCTDAELCMVGPDIDGSVKYIKEYAMTTGVAANIKITGRLSLNEWLTLSSEYDIFINTTYVDNNPVSVIEAMSLGMLIVSTNVGGLPYLLTDGSDALLVSKNDTVAMVEAVKKLINNQALCSMMSLNARKKAEGFAWESVRELWFDLFDKVNKSVHDPYI